MTLSRKKDKFGKQNDGGGGGVDGRGGSIPQS